MEPKKYNVIYADPPWEQKAGTNIPKYTVENGKQIWPKGSNRTQPLPYETMSINEICNLPVSSITADNSVLFMWITNKYLPSAFSVIEAWGFKYSTTIVWCKNMMGGGLGGTFKINTEYLLYAKKGSLPAKRKIPRTWHNVKRDYKNGYPKHSSKPEYFRGMIQVAFDGPYLEMFARKESEGWDVFGNQVNNSITLQ